MQFVQYNAILCSRQNLQLFSIELYSYGRAQMQPESTPSSARAETQDNNDMIFRLDRKILNIMHTTSVSRMNR